MKNPVFWFFVVGWFVLLFVSIAQGQEYGLCGERREIVPALAEEGELPAGHGTTPGGDRVEIFSDPVTGNWTFLASFPDGGACILYSGTTWVSVDHERTDQ